MGSESAKTLARALRVKRIIPDGGFRPGYNTTVVNWGNSSTTLSTTKMLNKPEAVKVAANKLLTFQVLQQAGIPIPEFSTTPEGTRAWTERGFRTVVRHKLTAHTGAGIQILQPEDAVPRAPLYTKYIKKDREYRVHVFKGAVIDITEKRKRVGAIDPHPLIRNLAQGWVFCRDGVMPVETVKTQSVAAVRALGLDFGAVDIVERAGQVWVLEVNTAPGLQGTTLTKYVDAFRRLNANSTIESRHTGRAYSGRINYR